LTVYVACPIWRYLDVRVAHSIISVMASLEGHERVYLETFDGDALISRTRSQLARKFVEEEQLQAADVMVIIDDDVQFSPDDFWKIVAGAREKGSLYGGIYATRSREPHMAALGYPGQELQFGPGQDAVPIKYLATGFMAVPVPILHEMIAHPGFASAHGKEKLLRHTQGVGQFPMWDFFRPFTIQEDDGQYHYLSEDWAFNERARQLGYEVWADQSIILHHRAVVSITVADISQPGHAMTAEGAPSKGVSILEVGPAIGSEQQELTSVVG